MNITLRDYAVFQPNVLHETREGYLEGRIRVTGAGVFTYLGNNGAKVRRLRTTDEVGAFDSVETLNGQPITLKHPSVDVTPDNAQRLSVGMAMNDAMWDGLNIWVTFRVTDAKAIKAIHDGEVEAVSCGYTADLIQQAGNWQGVDYDEIMTSIRYNHIALVKKGRAGDGVTIKVGDSADFEEIFNNNQEEKHMKKLMLDGAEFEVDEKVADALEAAKKEATENAAKVADQAAEIEKLNAANAVQAEEIKKLQDAAADESKIIAAAKERAQVMDAAKANGVEFADDATVSDIKAATVAKLVPGISLEGKSAEYCDAAYETAIGMASVKEGAKKNPLAPGFKDSKNEDDAYGAMKLKFQNGGK